AVLLRATASGLGGHLGRERRGLSRALQADGAGRGPRDHRTGGVGDRDDGVVERALDVGFALSDVLLLLATYLGGTALGRHSVSPELAGLVSSSGRQASHRWWRRLRSNRLGTSQITWPSSCRRRCAWDPCGCARWS